MRNWKMALLAMGLIGAVLVMVGCGQGGGTTTTTLPSPSISGTVNFATTSDGVKGGVDIMVTASPTVIATTSADANTGTFEVSDLDPGTYTLIASKDGWTIPNVVVTLESSALADQDFTANPTEWDVSFISGNPDLNKVASEELSGNNIVIIGKVTGASYYQSTNGGGTWNSGQATTDADSMLDVFLPSPNNIFFFCGSGLIRNSSNNGSSWNVMGILTIDAPSVYTKDFASTGNPTSENVGTNGKLYHTDDGSNFIKPGIDEPGFNAVTGWRDSSNIIRKVAVGEAGKIRYYDGSGWNNQDCPAPVIFQDVDAGEWSGEQRYVTMPGYLTTDSQGVIIGIWPESTTGGNVILAGVPYKLNGIWSPSGANDTNHSGVIVVGDNGLILKGK